MLQVFLGIQLIMWFHMTFSDILSVLTSPSLIRASLFFPFPPSNHSCCALICPLLCSLHTHTPIGPLFTSVVSLATPRCVLTSEHLEREAQIRENMQLASFWVWATQFNEFFSPSIYLARSWKRTG